MILVGVDGSAPSRVALRWSMARAAVTGEDVTLVHVVDDEWGVVSHQLSDEVGRDEEATLRREADYARSLHPSVFVTSTVLSGNPMWELSVASLRADLIVVGTHKTGFVRGRVFGSRSLQLAGAAHAPVAIIPESPARTGRGIVVGVNESPASEAAVRFASDEANRTDQELIVIGAWAAANDAMDSTDAQRRHNILIKSRIESVLAAAAALAKERHSGLSIRVRQVNRSSAEALIDASAAAELLVIGSSRREAAPTTLGSVAHDVLINIVGPTVIVHAEEGSSQ